MWDLRSINHWHIHDFLVLPFPSFLQLHFIPQSAVSPGAGSLGGALSGVYSSWMAQPLQAPCSEAHPRVTCSSKACHHALPGISVAYFGVFLFSGHQMHPPPPRLDFFLLLPSQMQVLQLSLRCIRLCILSVMEIACHPMCCDLCLWFWATARVTRSTGGWASLEGPEGPPWHFSHVAAHIQSFKLLYSFLVASQRAQKQKLAGSPTQGHTHPKSWIKASHKTRPDFMGGRQAHP